MQRGCKQRRKQQSQPKATGQSQPQGIGADAEQIDQPVGDLAEPIRPDRRFTSNLLGQPQIQLHGPQRDDEGDDSQITDQPPVREPAERAARQRHRDGNDSGQRLQFRQPPLVLPNRFFRVALGHQLRGDLRRSHLASGQSLDLALDPFQVALGLVDRLCHSDRRLAREPARAEVFFEAPSQHRCAECDRCPCRQVDSAGDDDDGHSQRCDGDG